MASDADYFEPDLVDRLKAKARQLRGQLRALLRFHNDYQRALLGDDGQVRADTLPMLADLRAFCFAEASTHHPEPARAQANVGRREVWLRLELGLRIDRKQLESLNRQLKELDEDD